MTEDFKNLEQKIGHAFVDGNRLKTALTHRSYHFDHKEESPGHFERFEFLGDAVLDLILSETLMEKYPEVDEGTLSKWRASLVNESTLADVARQLNLGRHLYLGRSENQNRETAESRPRLLASAFEALIAALYLDAGLEKTRQLTNELFASLVERLDREVEFVLDYKTRLQEWAQKNLKILPEYRMTGSQGPEHAKIFEYEVLLNGERFGFGGGSSRKAAEQSAAKAALEKIGDKT